MSTATPEQGAAYRSMARVSPRDEGGAEVLEVMAVWGRTEVLAVAHLHVGERFVLRSREDRGARDHGMLHPSVEGEPVVLAEHTRAGAFVRMRDGESVTVERRAVVRAALGDVSFFVQLVPKAERLPRSKRDRLLGVATALSLLCTVALGGTLQRGGVSSTDADTRMRSLTWITVRAKPVPPRAYAPASADTGVGEGGGTGHRAMGSEGRTGLTTARRASRRWTTAPRHAGSQPDVSLRVPTGSRGMSDLSGRGIFAALGNPGAFQFQFPLQGASEREHMSGNMHGADTGEALGYAGLGLTGQGRGGGDTGDRRVGLGRLPTRGHGTDDGTGQGFGSMSGCGCMEGMPLHGSMSGRAGVSMGTPLLRSSSGPLCTCGAPGELSGLISAAEIRRVVLRNLGQVRHCYEQALEVNPGATGRVSVRWVIGGEGQVLASATTENTIGSETLGTCLANAVRRWQFSAPTGGGIVTVNYPFDLTLLDP